MSQFRDTTYNFLHFDKTSHSESTQNCNSSNALLMEVSETPKNLFEMHRSSEIHRFKVAKISNQIWFLDSEILVRSMQELQQEQQQAQQMAMQQQQAENQTAMMKTPMMDPSKNPAMAEQMQAPPQEA